MAIATQLVGERQLMVCVGFANLQLYVCTTKRRCYRRVTKTGYYMHERAELGPCYTMSKRGDRDWVQVVVGQKEAGRAQGGFWGT